MTKSIILVDAAGMSISMLSNKMNQAAKDKGLDYEVFGLADAAVKAQIEKDTPVVIMIAPQVKYMFDKYNEEYGKDIPVVNINMSDYGMMKGDAILDAAIASEK